LNEDDVRDFIDAYLLEIKHHKHEFATTLTKRLASSAIVDSIDLMPNPKPLNTKHTALSNKSNDWFVQKEDTVSILSDSIYP
jgi:hypothetical protein